MVSKNIHVDCMQYLSSQFCTPKRAVFFIIKICLFFKRIYNYPAVFKNIPIFKNVIVRSF
jgi:hypothetical protein